MIPVELQPEPDGFDRQVRQPGLDAIREMTGAMSRPGPGRKREVIAESPEDIPSGKFPEIWRKALPDLLKAYNRICAYACLYIHRTTGAAGVDHFAPRSRKWDRIYEWDNYRLACSLMNSRKGRFDDVLDPVGLEPGTFVLDLVSMKALPGKDLEGDRLIEAQDTIRRLGLASDDYASALGDYYEAYSTGEVTFAFLEERAPFLASELCRQGKL